MSPTDLESGVLELFKWWQMYQIMFYYFKSIMYNEDTHCSAPCQYCDFKTEIPLNLEEHVEEGHWDQND